MKQKIVIKVHMSCEKCRTKAMKVAATTSGVNSVALQGNDKDQLVVMGDKVDSACLATTLKKKVGHAMIVSVEQVVEKNPKGKPDDTNVGVGDKGKEQEKPISVVLPPPYIYPNPIPPPYYCYCPSQVYVPAEPYPACTIL
ncbi:hypothetical protein Dimus_027945 [Dionaea muscipula]